MSDLMDGLMIALIIADLGITAAGNRALWRKVDEIGTRLTVIETEHKGNHG
jgi:hypothetical protein